MPTYEYRCPQGHAFEKFAPTMTGKRSAPCPQCGKRAERLISGGAGFVFKGTGFYATDYKRTGQPADGDAKDSAAKGGDTKPAESEKSKGKKKKDVPSGDK